MFRSQRILVIAAKPDAVWAEFSRFMYIADICEGITHVDAMTDGENGVGSKRHNHFANDNGSMVEEITAWSPIKATPQRT